MYNLADLFDQCNRVAYETIGEEVNYAFKKDKDTLYIFFEPSDGKIDWKHNFMFAKRPYKDMKIPYKVHRGFLKCWKYIEDIIIEKIKDNSIKSIVSVGYSHGGALAMLCHECIWYHRPDIRNTIYGVSFDGPRVYAGFRVKKSLKERWNNFIVVRNHNDIVTHVPPRIFGYSHVGHIMKVGKKARYGCFKSHYASNILRSLKGSEWNDSWESFIQIENGKGGNNGN